MKVINLIKKLKPFKSFVNIDEESNTIEIQWKNASKFEVEIGELTFIKNAQNKNEIIGLRINNSDKICSSSSKFRYLFNIEDDIMYCFECETGKYKSVYKDYLLDPPLGCDKDPVTIQEVKHEVCNKCGDVCLGNDAMKMIDDIREQQNYETI